MPIVPATSLDGFFKDALDDAFKVRRLEASPAATSYLVAVLAEFARPDARMEATLDRPLSILLNEAVHTNELGERFERLRTLGDGVLYSSGFFADHFERRGVDQSYLVGIGSGAYARASSILRSGREEERGTDIFRELAERFQAFVGVVAEVANLTISKSVESSRGLLKVYERWLKTRSETLAGALAAHGFHAPKGRQDLS